MLPKTIPHNINIIIFSESINTNEGNDDVQLRRNLHSNYNTQQNASKNRSVSLVDRLSKLQCSQNSWQSKVPEKDARKFTVEGKMKQDPTNFIAMEDRKVSRNLNEEKFDNQKMIENGNNAVQNTNCNSTQSPNSTKKEEYRDAEKSPTHSPARGTPSRSSFRLKKTPNQMNFKSSPPLQRHPSNRRNSIIADHEEVEKIEKYDKLEPQKIETHVEVELPLQNDKGFSDFFTTAKKEKEPQSEVLEDCDFDLLLPAIAGNRHNSKLQHHKKEFAKTRNVQRRKPPTKNPLKALAERSDIRQSYMETTVMANDSEIKTLQIDTTKKHALAEKSK